MSEDQNLLVRRLTASLLLFGAFYTAGFPLQNKTPVAGATPVKIFFDTDMHTDCDDAGALAVLHALADKGECEILATVVSVKDYLSAATVNAINGYYGRPNLPLGMVKGAGVLRKSNFTARIASDFPHRVHSAEAIPDALEVYRDLLERQADDSVVLVTVGYLTNLRNLLEAPAELGRASGRDLIRRKVKTWVCMGGNFLGSPPRDDLKLGNVNFQQDATATLRVIPDWPGPVVFVGREIGSVPSGLQVGANLSRTPEENPVRMAYVHYFGGQQKSRHVADLTTVLYAVRGLRDYWEISPSGRMALEPDVKFSWQFTADGNQRFLLKKRLGGQPNDRYIEAVLDELLLQPPRPRGRAEAVAIPPDRPAVTRAAPYPPSPVIAKMEWAPTNEIVRAAPDGDNWPVTWADDDALYTTWGDGTGFVPKTEKKLSLGFARVTGPPEDFKGVNVRSEAEQLGQGRAGKKGWGLLGVDGVLYLWLGHADNKGAAAQLAWSHDHAKTWTFADWKFSEFGLLGFVNFGRNYSGARDEFVYAYSHDDPRADTPSDRFVLLRAPKHKLTSREAWQFFAHLDLEGLPVWTSDIRKRGGVFEHRDSCLRSAITYCAPLKRYFWWQHLPQPVGNLDRGDTRFTGGFAIYDAREPWGPWTTAFFTEKWDVGPGEHGDFPAKWMTADGQTLHLVFSGNDSFSVRQANVRLITTTNQPPPIRTSFVSDGMLSANELEAVVQLANRCGMGNVAEVRTQRRLSGITIEASGDEKLEGRKVLFKTLQIHRDGWEWIKRPQDGCKSVGEFWVDASVQPRQQESTIVQIEGRSLRVGLGGGIKPAGADKIVDALVKGRIRYASDGLRDALSHVDLTQPRSIGLSGGNISITFSQPLTRFIFKVVSDEVLLVDVIRMYE